MVRVLVVIALVLAACAPTVQTVNLVNRTPRKIVELYVYSLGSANHGASRGTLAPGATLTLKLPIGHLEVRAVSERIQIDDTQGETREASTALQLEQVPVDLVFHDSNQVPPGLARPNTIGVAFRVSPGEGAPPASPAEPTAPSPVPAH